MYNQLRSACLLLFSALAFSLVSQADPVPPEFFGVYLVTQQNELIELKSLRVNRCHFFVPSKNTGDPLKQLMRGDTPLQRALGAMDKSYYYVQLEQDPPQVSQAKFKGFVVYGEYEIQSFFLDQFLPSSKFIPQTAQFVETDVQKAKSPRSYFSLGKGWSIKNEEALRYKSLKPDCYYIVLRVDEFNLDSAVEYLGINLGTERRWLFEYFQPVRKIESLYDRKEYDQVIELATEAIESASPDEEIYLMRAYSYYDKALYEKAIEDTQVVIELNPEKRNAFMLGAGAHFQRKEYDRAFELYTKVLELNPESSTATMMRGRIHLRKGKTKEAVDEFERMVEMDPKNWQSYFYRGWGYLRERRFDDAASDGDRIIDLSPKLINGFWLRGTALVERGEYRKGLKDLNQAVKFGKDEAYVYVSRAYGYRLKGDFKRALEDLGKATELDPQNPAAWLNRVPILIQAGETDKALEMAEKGLRLTTGDDPWDIAVGLAFRAEALWHLGRHKEAEEVIEEAKSQNALPTDVQRVSKLIHAP